MSGVTHEPAKRFPPILLGWLEVALVLAVFFVQGAWEPPDVNEPYYLAKAKHFWNPAWIPGDFFLETPDTHQVFYFTLGWLTRWLSLPALAWTGRIITWLLLAWSWRRLSRAVVPRWGATILSAGLLVLLNDRFHMAGEWIVGGLEAKGFAFALVFLGLEAMLHGAWRRTWILLGAASAFHVLVGGWSTVAAGIAWMLLGRQRPSLRSMLPALVAGFLLSLPGLIPSLLMNRGVPSDIVARANEIYVFQRLSHHLDPMQMSLEFRLRFLLMVAVGALGCRIARNDQRLRPLLGFVGGAVLIAACGVLIACLQWWNRPLAAALLRFYWFRLSDAAVPAGCALLAVLLLAKAFQAQLQFGVAWLLRGAFFVALLGGAGYQMTVRAVQLDWPSPALEEEFPGHVEWIEACQWIANSGVIPKDARFFTRRTSSTFKWYAGRAEVVNWKEIPQDARSIVEWWDRLQTVYGTGIDLPEERWHFSMTGQGLEGALKLSRDFQAEYLIEYSDPMPFDKLHDNGVFSVFRLRIPPAP